MKKISVQPLKGFANITFGMAREQVRQLLDGFNCEFKKFPSDLYPTDDFGYCHVFYDSNGKCEAVEFFSEVEIQIGKQTIVPGKVREAIKVIPDLSENEGFWLSKKLSIGITTTSEEKIESILFGCANYYA